MFLGIVLVHRARTDILYRAFMSSRQKYPTLPCGTRGTPVLEYRFGLAAVSARYPLNRPASCLA